MHSLPNLSSLPSSSLRQHTEQLTKWRRKAQSPRWIVTLLAVKLTLEEASLGHFHSARATCRQAGAAASQPQPEGTQALRHRPCATDLPSSLCPSRGDSPARPDPTPRGHRSTSLSTRAPISRGTGASRPPVICRGPAGLLHPAPRDGGRCASPLFPFPPLPERPGRLQRPAAPPSKWGLRRGGEMAVGQRCSPCGVRGGSPPPPGGSGRHTAGSA